MRVNCQKEDLLYGVQSVVRAVSSKNTLPILSGILLVAENGTLTFKATDLEIAIECTINVDIVEEGSVVVPGKYFSDQVRNLPQCQIELISINQKQLKVSYGLSELIVNCQDPEEFPALPQVSGEITGSIPNEVFRRLVRQVAIAAAVDEVRPIFTGILLELKPNKLTMVATDTHRLAIGRGIWHGEGEVNIILPSRPMQEISRLMTNDSEVINITASKNQVHFCYGNITFTSRVISGQYPDYNQVLPSESLYITKTITDKQKLLNALEIASLCVNKGNIVKLNWQDDNLTIYADAEVGNVKEEIPTMIEGQNVEASYNVRYLLEALKVLEGEKVVMRLTGPATPGVIMPDSEDDSYLYLVLPIRINS